MGISKAPNGPMSATQADVIRFVYICKKKAEHATRRPQEESQLLNVHMSYETVHVCPGGASSQICQTEQED